MKSLLQLFSGSSTPADMTAAAPQESAADAIPDLRGVAVEAEREFQRCPSTATLSQAQTAAENLLAAEPDDWQSLHAYLGLCTTTGFVSKALQAHAGIIRLKRSLKSRYDLDDVGFSVLPQGFASAVGNLAILDLILKAQDLGWCERARMILPVPAGAAANEALLELLAEKLKVVRNETGIASIKDFVGYSEFGGALMIRDSARLFWEASHEIQREWEARQYPPKFAPSAAMEERTQRYLRGKGVRDGQWYVCLHVRTEGKYQDDWSLRNASIDRYFPAIERIIAAGGWVVRMGDANMPPMSPIRGLIDYANDPDREDVLDIGLCARCHFFFGTASGLGHVSTMFGIPGLFTNWMPWGIMPWSPRDIVIPKLFREKKSGRILNARESLAEPIGFIQDIRQLDIHGIECLENSPEELADAASEMLAAVAGCEIPAPAPCQERFAEIERSIGICRSNARLSASFGSRHPELWQ